YHALAATRTRLRRACPAARAHRRGTVIRRARGAGGRGGS
nr:hypothetical protein [Tanacetum cinerariifolium]